MRVGNVLQKVIARRFRGYKWNMNSDDVVEDRVPNGVALDVHGATLEDGGLKFVRSEGDYVRSQEPVDISTHTGRVEIRASVRYDEPADSIRTIFNLGLQPGSSSSGRFFLWLYMNTNSRLTAQFGTVTGRTAPALYQDMDSYVGQVVDIRVIIDYSVSSAKLYLNGMFIYEFVSGSAFHPPRPETLYVGGYQGVSHHFDDIIYSLNIQSDYISM